MKTSTSRTGEERVPCSPSSYLGFHSMAASYSLRKSPEEGLNAMHGELPSIINTISPVTGGH